MKHREAARRTTWVAGDASGGIELKNFLVGIEDGNLRERGVQVLSHGSGTAVQNGFQRIAARKEQADLSAKSSQAGLLEGCGGRGALALEGVADASLERIGLELHFDDVV